MVTSRYTMDARNPAARREITALADLAGAIRLPSGVHQQAAGTKVITDLLIFRRREPGRDPGPAAWEQTQAAENALWYTIRTLTDKSVLARQLAGQARGRGEEETAAGFEGQGRRAEEQLQALRRIAEGG